jgi:hypothetical protein
VTAAAGPGRADQGRRLLDEAVRLIDVVQAVQGGGHPPEGDCRWCPVCRGVAALREVDPDAMTRIAGAVGDLAGAVRDLLAPPAGRPAAGSERGPADGDSYGGSGGDDAGPPGPTVQRIVVTD